MHGRMHTHIHTHTHIVQKHDQNYTRKILVKKEHYLIRQDNTIYKLLKDKTNQNYTNKYESYLS